MNERPKIVVIVGPTAVGKTVLSLEIAQKFNGEIVSGDSMQIYRQLDIGTAKATRAEQRIVPHHLIDIAEPTEHFSAAQFVDLAREAIDDITARQKLPIVVGGTGFYIQALLGDRPLAEVGVDDQASVDKWLTNVAQQGEQELREAVRLVDPVSAQRILPGQTRRLIRALLVSEQTGRPFSEQQPVPERKYDAYIIGLSTVREQLYARINHRVIQMVEAGLMTEVALAYALPDDATAKKAIGYKELFPVLTNDVPLEMGISKLQQASRQYAKRQLTWFNNQFQDIHWYDLVAHPTQLTAIFEAIIDFM
ncbi:tRNA (adenosine(37)-N6)-dimethylallyltransferase MiaA [Weissella diestrammenae]|uniref:tRNA dimethylallyltransferase n=1 Tax=Weissella diestrammenae TaxID=1162633 RepID=A0A7G9T3U5_9LACO|nr:tRNA (adenosine(37)-N6)-dimethylallyltransferase MiaA [Weissella diestrammenae]MCM0582757.1 tRNA (adenosine(37)-N6)-dimethylallyltransferase MiaA [Weissella diestrammenae]QNN74770.1 tRNA (adenosine(37)-N6)-dimethylallyltransferase MiaA [Weissella diestrammenae]